MGQLFNRILKIGKNYFQQEDNKSHFISDSYLSDDIFNDDEELKRTIDGLKNHSKTSNNKAERKSTFSTEIKLSFQELEIDPIDLQKGNLKKEEIINLIKKQYKLNITKYHPDRHQGSSLKEKKILEEKTTKINNSYNTLKQYYNF